MLDQYHQILNEYYLSENSRSSRCISLYQFIDTILDLILLSFFFKLFLLFPLFCSFNLIMWISFKIRKHLLLFVFNIFFEWMINNCFNNKNFMSFQSVSWWTQSCFSLEFEVSSLSIVIHFVFFSVFLSSILILVVIVTCLFPILFLLSFLWFPFLFFSLFTWFP